MRAPRQLLASVGALILGLGPAASAPAQPRAEASPDAFGRWQQSLRRCRISLSLPPAPPGATPTPTARGAHSCRLLRLDQHMEGLLVVRWLDGDTGSRPASRQLSFAGLLDQSSPPLRCTAEGRCQPVGTMAVWVSAVAEAGFDPRTPASGLPRTRLVRGLCRLERRHFLCEGTEGDGSRWLAEGSR